MALQMSYIHKPSVEPLEHRNIMQLFDIQANDHPNREAFVLYSQDGQRTSHTFEQMQRKSLHLAASFLRIGWKRGRRIALMVPNRIEFLLSYMALLRIGVNVILVPSSGLNPHEVIGILERSKSLGLIICTSTNCSFDAQLISMVTKLNIHDSDIVWIDAEHGTPIGQQHLYDDFLEIGGDLDLNEVIKEQNQVQFDDPAGVMFTSGSTGQPKGVQHTHHANVNGTILMKSFGFNAEVNDKGKPICPRSFGDRPFYWSGCQSLGIFPVLILGCTLITVPALKSVKECDIDFCLNVIQNEKCTNAFMMPYMIVDLVNHPSVDKYDLSSVTATITGGQPLDSSLLGNFMSILPNCKLYTIYGQTEVAGVTAYELLSTQRDGDGDDYQGLDLLQSIEVKIVDYDVQLVPIGEEGEICIRSPLSFLGYLENAEATSEAISSTGWVHTGDLGFLNQKGKLIFSGRKSEMIKRATVKIFPAEVEKVILQYPEVKDTVVVGVPDVRLYEELCACVIPKKGSTLESSVAEFEDWMSSQWTPDEQGLTLKPKYLVIMEEFPKMKTGKSDRKATRIAAAERLGIELE